MMKYVMVILFSIMFMLGYQLAITDNDVFVFLEDDSTFFMLDSITEPLIPFATIRDTLDARRVLLRSDGTWEFVKRGNYDIDTLYEISSLPKSSMHQHHQLFLNIEPYYRVAVKPKPIRMPTPRYPELARQREIEGTTVVLMLVDITGYVCDVKIIKSSGNEWLDKAAYKAAMYSTFTPAESYERKVRVWVGRPIKFQLSK